MLRVVLDTNALASGAIANEGTMKRLMDAWQADAYQLHTTPSVECWRSVG